EKSKTLETRLQELARQRKELAEKMDEDLLGRFERLFVSKGDSAIVAVEHGVCTGCHMKLTVATIKATEAGKEIVNCEQCGRILYVPASLGRGAWRQPPWRFGGPPVRRNCS